MGNCLNTRRVTHDSTAPLPAGIEVTNGASDYVTNEATDDVTNDDVTNDAITDNCLHTVDDTRTKRMAAPLQTDSQHSLPDDVTNDINIENCLNTFDDTLLAAQLESGIKRDSFDDVRAALEQGAPVNFRYKVKSIYLLKSRAVNIRSSYKM